MLSTQAVTFNVINAAFLGAPCSQCRELCPSGYVPHFWRKMDLHPLTMNLNGNSRISPPQQTNAKKKRRVNPNSLASRRAEAALNAAAAKQNCSLPPSLGYNDTMIATNPFDDNINQPSNTSMPNNLPMYHSMSHTNARINNINPMQINNMDYMMSPMNGHAFDAIINHPNFPHMNAMNNLSQNVSQLPMEMAQDHRMFSPAGNRPFPGRIMDPRIDMGSNYAKENSMAPLSGPPMNTASRNYMNVSNGSLPRQPRPPRGMMRTQGMPALPDMNAMLPGAMMNNGNSFRSPRNLGPPDSMNGQLPQYQYNPRFNSRPMSDLPPSMIGKLPGPGLHTSGSILQSQLMRSYMENPKSTMIPDMEKMFPPNQPMIFNDRNPNAPPTAPCGVCHMEVHGSDYGIFCESGCNFWFHRRCTGLTEVAYDMLLREPYAEWACHKCLQTKNIPLVKIKP